MNNDTTPTIQDQPSEDRSDTVRALAKAAPSGDLYIVEYCSLWLDDTCVGTRIIASTDALVRRDLLDDDQELTPSQELFDRIRRWEGLSAENADWLQDLDEDGHLTYPIGAAA